MLGPFSATKKHKIGTEITLTDSTGLEITTGLPNENELFRRDQYKKERTYDFGNIYFSPENFEY